MSSKQLGKIGRVATGIEADDRFRTVWVHLDFDGSGQGFGGLMLGSHDDPDKTFLVSYEKDLCATFGVATLQDLVGKECYALRSFDDWNANIEGLEALDGKRFTVTTWRRQHWPETTKTPLERERADLFSRIEHAHRMIRDASQALQTLAARFVDWESK